MLLVGLIPGPNEPSDMNPFLSPLVEDLKRLFEGVYVTDPLHRPHRVKIRAFLACIICDLPATRKLCGFSNFNALRGCSKCLKLFPTEQFGTKPDYSGYNLETWTNCDLATHVRNAIAASDACTAAERREIKRTYGCKYSKLLELPAFNIIRYHVIDPMHNLFLCEACNKTVERCQYFSKRRSNIIQENVDSLIVPSKIGQLPRKIGSNFAALTADEWKNWTLVFSVYALDGFLADDHYHCWHIFVKACRLLIQSKLTEIEVRSAHMHLREFCSTFQQLYGAENYTPNMQNMHMACHLADCVLDYGVLSSFLVFSI